MEDIVQSGDQIKDKVVLGPYLCDILLQIVPLLTENHKQQLTSDCEPAELW